MLLRTVLTKILQSCQTTFRFLYLVKEYERLTCLTWHTTLCTYDTKNTLRIIILHEQFLQMFCFFKVDIGKVIIVSITKFLHSPSLSYLPSTFDDKWFSASIFFPFKQLT